MDASLDSELCTPRTPSPCEEDQAGDAVRRHEFNFYKAKQAAQARELVQGVTELWKGIDAMKKGLSDVVAQREAFEARLLLQVGELDTALRNESVKREETQRHLAMRLGEKLRLREDADAHEVSARSDALERLEQKLEVATAKFGARLDSQENLFKDTLKGETREREEALKLLSLRMEALSKSCEEASRNTIFEEVERLRKQVEAQSKAAAVGSYAVKVLVQELQTQFVEKIEGTQTRYDDLTSRFSALTKEMEQVQEKAAIRAGALVEDATARFAEKFVRREVVNDSELEKRLSKVERSCEKALWNMTLVDAVEQTKRKAEAQQNLDDIMCKVSALAKKVDQLQQKAVKWAEPLVEDTPHTPRYSLVREMDDWIYGCGKSIK